MTRSPRDNVTSGMIIERDARQRRPRLALAAGTHRDHLVRRQIAVGIGRAEILYAVQIAGFARDLHQPVHGAPDDDDLAVGGARGIGDRLDARDIGGKGRDRNARRRALDQRRQSFRNFGFRRRTAFAHRIGRIPDHGEATFVAERAQLGFVGRRADQGRGIDFPIAGVQHGAEIGANNQRIRFRNRMSERHQLNVERPQRETAAERDHLDVDLRRAGFGLTFRLDQRCGKRRGVDRHLEARPKIEQARRNDLRGRGSGQSRPGSCVAPPENRCRA